MERMILLHLQSKEDETREEIAKTLREYADVIEAKTLGREFNEEGTVFRFYYGPRGTKATSFNLFHSLTIDTSRPEKFYEQL